MKNRIGDTVGNSYVHVWMVCGARCTPIHVCSHQAVFNKQDRMNMLRRLIVIVLVMVLCLCTEVVCRIITAIPAFALIGGKSGDDETGEQCIRVHISPHLSTHTHTHTNKEVPRPKSQKTLQGLQGLQGLTHALWEAYEKPTIRLWEAYGKDGKPMGSLW